FYICRAPHAIHSFPTRRSSDLRFRGESRAPREDDLDGRIPHCCRVLFTSKGTEASVCTSHPTRRIPKRGVTAEYRDKIPRTYGVLTRALSLLVRGDARTGDRTVSRSHLPPSGPDPHPEDGPWKPPPDARPGAASTTPGTATSTAASSAPPWSAARRSPSC